MLQSLRASTGALLLLSLALVPCAARAASDGVSGRSGRAGGSCVECHVGGAAPIVGITGPDGLGPGRLGTFTFTLSGGQEVAGGLDVAVAAGSLAVAPGQEETTRLWNGEITHTAPLEGATLAWTFQWVAPDEPGTYTIHAAGASVDGDGTADGDGGATTSFEVTVAGCLDGDGDGYEAADCNPNPVAGGGDCDDDDDTISPGRAEACDGVDQDCDGLTDEDPGVRLCDDGDPCTTERCEAGVCEYDDNTAACDDGDPCTGDDHCVEGVCVGPIAVTCDDGDPCTIDTCAPGEGCVATPDDGASCDDGDPCTSDDVCLDGVCAGVAVCPCESDDDCAPFASSDRCAGTLVCDLDRETPACVVDPATVVVCPADGDTECARSRCDPATGGCVLTDVPDGTPCDVANACVSGATCTAGVCGGGTEASCDDGVFCTDDRCDPVGGCLHLNATTGCDDGDACTRGDQCRGGVCEPGPLAACGDDNPCTVDSCDPAEGCRHEALDDVPCNDRDACSVGDRCTNGICAADAERDCDDGNPCTDDSCDSEQGCVHAQTNAPCDDGDACTDGDTCHAGRCLPGGPTDCDDGDPCTDDRCEAGAGCVHDPHDGDCDDGDVCTVGDTCADGGCVGRARTCDDFDVCTADGCDPVEGCVYEPIPGCCVVAEDCGEGRSCVDGVCRGGALCAPCAEDADCGGEGDACVALPNGLYCGEACEDAADCPADHDCESVPGEDRLQCIPAAGVCECTPRFERRCDEGDVYWFDACGERGERQRRCPYGCVGTTCVPDDGPIGDATTPRPDVLAPDTGGSEGPSGDDDGGGDGGGGCAAGAGGAAPGPLAFLALLLALSVAVGRARRVGAAGR